jgi:hypothetical protein
MLLGRIGESLLAASCALEIDAAWGLTDDIWRCRRTAAKRHR